MIDTHQTLNDQMHHTPIIDLFAGAGGFSLGAHLAGFRSALAVELDSVLASSHKLNFEKTPLLLGDLARLEPKVLLQHAGIRRGETFGITGGPPCQGFSSIGRRCPQDPRNDLVLRFLDIVGALRPSFFVMENVPGLLSSEIMEHLELRLGTLRSAFSITGPFVLDAADFGAATNRRRVIVIGIRQGAGNAPTEKELLKYSAPAVPVRDAFQGLPALCEAVPDSEGDYWAAYSPTDTSGLCAYARYAMSRPEEPLGSPEVRDTFMAGKISGLQPTRHALKIQMRFGRVPAGGTDPVSKYPRLRWDRPAPTLRAGTGPDRGSYQAARPIHPDQNRVISVREAARVQGFPDWFRFHPAKWHSFRMIGNSVSPPFAKAVLLGIRDALKLS